MYPNYQNNYQDGGNNYQPQPQMQPQNGEGKRGSRKSNLVNNGYYVGMVLPITGKMEDEIRVSPLRNKDGVVVHFTLLIEEPSGTDQYGQQKTKKIYRRITAFSNKDISPDLLRSLRAGDTVKISASDIDEPYDKRDGTKGYREAKLAYRIEITGRAAAQPGQYQPAQAPGGYYPQGTPMQQPQYGGYPALQPPQGQPGYYPQGAPAPQYQGGQPQYGGYPARQPAPQGRPYGQGTPASAAQPQKGPQWDPRAAERKNAQAATPPYYQAPGPGAPPPSDEDMPADIAAGVRELDV